MFGLFEARLQVALLDGPDWLVEGLGSDGFLSSDQLVNQCPAFFFSLPNTMTSPHLDGDDGLQLLVLDLHGLSSSLGMKLSVGHHGTDDVAHAGHLQR